MADSAFLALTPEELGSWREQPVTRAFLEWVDIEIERGKDSLADMVFKNLIDQSRVKVGTLFALYNIRSAAYRPAPMPEPEEEQFIDPATRPSTLRDK